MIDATGSQKPFRQWLNIGVTAKKGDDRWCIADVRFSTRPPTERHTWIEAPFNDNRAVWQHLMADDVWRIDYQMAPNADPEYVSSEAQVRERLASQFGADTQVDIVWVGPYAYRSECVDHMCVDLGAKERPQSKALRPHSVQKPLASKPPGTQAASQVFLIGDSAKVVSPFGARGGNTGIADADNLAWKLAAVVQGHAAPALLASYHAERHEAATTNVQVTNRTARFLRPADGIERLFRSATIGLAKTAPVCARLDQHRAHGSGQPVQRVTPHGRGAGQQHLGAKRRAAMGPRRARQAYGEDCRQRYGQCRQCSKRHRLPE